LVVTIRWWTRILSPDLSPNRQKWRKCPLARNSSKLPLRPYVFSPQNVALHTLYSLHVCVTEFASFCTLFIFKYCDILNACDFFFSAHCNTHFKRVCVLSQSVQTHSHTPCTPVSTSESRRLNSAIRTPSGYSSSSSSLSLDPLGKESISYSLRPRPDPSAVCLNVFFR
jgi:hypothetical protein